MFHRFLGGVRLRFKMILTVTRILEEQNQMSAIIFQKKSCIKGLSFLFLLAPFISKQKKQKNKKKKSRKRPTFNWQVFGQY